jgi:hypothetical protein
MCFSKAHSLRLRAPCDGVLSDRPPTGILLPYSPGSDVGTPR